MSSETADARSARAGHGSLTDRVYEQLKEQILLVERKPGEVVLEGELAVRCGVSKTPVREALRLLAKEGWVVVMPRKGYLVRPLGMNDVREVFALRHLLEPPLAATASSLATRADLTHLASIVATQAAAGDDIDAALRSAREFHLAVTDIAGNSRAHNILSGLLDEVHRVHHLMPNIEGHITSAGELEAHRGILAAFEAGEAETAASLMREHLNEVARALSDSFNGVQPG